jgi:hypothetical protein
MQIVGKWSEGGWVVLISFSLLAGLAHLSLLSPIGFREPNQIHRIVRDKARVQGHMASIVEWQSLRMQEYRYTLLTALSRFFEIFGVHRPVHDAKPVPSGAYENAIHADMANNEAFLAPYLTPKPAPHIGGQPNETAAPEAMNP